MSSSSRFYTPSNLCLRGTRYYFRMAIPLDLRIRLRKREYRVCLDTPDLREAKRRSACLGVFIRELFNRLRRGDDLMGKMTAEQINGLVREWLVEQLARGEEERAMGSHRITYGKDYDRDKGDPVLDCLSDMQAMDRRALVEMDYSSISSNVDDLLKEKRLSINREGLDYALLCRELLKTRIKYWEIETEREQGVYRGTEQGYFQPISAPLPNATATACAVTPAVKTCKPERLMSEVIKAYIDLKEMEKAWVPKTRMEIVPLLEDFCQAIEDPTVGELSREHLHEFRDFIYRLPSNWRKKPAYREKTIQQIKKMEIPEKDRMSDTTISNRLNKINSMLKWGQINYDLPLWAGEIMRPARRRQKPVREDRDIFTEEDLHKLFNSQEYLQDEFKQPYRFWLPLLGLHTGARLEELCQLHLDDIERIDEVWCFNIRADEGDMKHLKNANATRLIPIHPILIEIGLLDRVAFLKKRKETRLFPELKKKTPTSKYGDYVTRWFRTYKERVGIEARGKGEKVFHSFRHTFSDYCKQHGLDVGKCKELIGHSTGKGEFEQRYTKATQVRILFEEVISRINFGLDIERLKGSRYARVF